MADIQVAVESSLGTTVMTTTTTATNDGSSQDDTSVLQGRVLFVGNTTTQQSSTPASLRSTPRHHPRATPSTRLFESWPLFLHVRVDKEGVFQVDPKQLVTTELVLHDQSNNNNLPPCLLLTFSTCLWRIFPLHTPSPTKPVSSDSDNTSRDEWKQAAVESLQTLEKSLHQLLQSGTSSAAWSPCTSSSLSNNETGQRDIHTSSSSSASHHNHHKKFKGVPKTEALQDHNTVRKVRRQRDALNRSILGLRSMEVVLESPASSFLHNNNRDNNNNNDTCADSLDAAQTQVQNTRQQQQQQSLVPLLAGITEDLSAAFGNDHDKQEALQAYRRKLDDTRDMEQLLDAFFPPSAMASGGSRRRRSRSRGRNTNTEVVAQTTKPAEEVIPAVQQLLTKQQALMKERSSLLALPTRG
eukprot:Sro479_g151150.1 n/a (412) ;mRNA; r:13106-14341